MPADVQDRLGRQLGADFSGVRQRTDPSAAAIGADAYTLGRQIVFAPGRYVPGTPSGLRLLAHELSHVVQQRGSAEPQPMSHLTIGAASDPVEREAADVADHVPAGEPVSVGSADDGGQVRRQSPAEGANQQGADDSGTHTGGGASGINTAWDSQVRMQYYVNEARGLSQQVLDDLNSGRINHMEARQTAQTMRNEALAATRERLTPGGRAVSEAIKEEGRTLPQLVEQYSQRIVRGDPARFGLSPAEVEAAERAAAAARSGRAAAASDAAAASRVAAAARTIQDTEEVSVAIIRAAGRTSRAMTVVARIGRVAGPAGVLISLGASGYEIAHAQPGVETARVATREAGGFAGGWLGATAGGLAAGWTASLLCGPGAAVCAIIVTLVVVGGAAYAGGRAGEWTATSTFDALLAMPGALVSGVRALAETAQIVGQGVNAMITAGIGEVFYAGYGSLDAANWQLSNALSDSTRADLSVMGSLVWAQMRPGGAFQRRTQGQSTLDAFISNSGRPLTYFGANRQLLAGIAADCARANPSAGITVDQLMATTPVGLVALLRDNGLLFFRQDPATYARRVLASTSPR